MRDWVNYVVSRIYSETCLNRTPFARNRQVLGLDRSNSLTFTILGLVLMFSLHTISVFVRVRFMQVWLYLRTKQSCYCFIVFSARHIFPNVIRLLNMKEFVIQSNLPMWPLLSSSRLFLNNTCSCHMNSTTCKRSSVL